MIVKELIERLTAEDPQKRVVVDGYESGYDEVDKVRLVCIKPNPHKGDNEKDDNWWDGEFQECLSDSEGIETAVCLPRKS